MVGPIGYILYLRNISFSSVSGRILTRRSLSAQFGSVRFGFGSDCQTVRVRSVRFVLLKDMGSVSVRLVPFPSLLHLF